MKSETAKLDEIVLNDEDQPFKDDDKDLTFKAAYRNAVIARGYLNEGGQFLAFGESQEDKYKLGMIAHKLRAKSQVILNDDEVRVLKARVGKLYPPVLIVALFDVLDGKGSALKRASRENEDEEPEVQKRAAEPTPEKVPG